jgi:simple sugar transport system substrate-binding protein
MLVAREQLGDRAKTMHFGTIDLGDPALQGLVNHTLDFALDQQQYMQGYLPSVILMKYIRYGITPAADFIPTGPGIITAENAATIIKLSAENVR